MRPVVLTVRIEASTPGGRRAALVARDSGSRVVWTRAFFLADAPEDDSNALIRAAIAELTALVDAGPGPGQGHRAP